MNHKEILIIILILVFLIYVWKYNTSPCYEDYEGMTHGNKILY